MYVITIRNSVYHAYVQYEQQSFVKLLCDFLILQSVASYSRFLEYKLWLAYNTSFPFIHGLGKSSAIFLHK